MAKMPNKDGKDEFNLAKMGQKSHTSPIPVWHRVVSNFFTTYPPYTGLYQTFLAYFPCIQGSPTFSSNFLFVQGCTKLFAKFNKLYRVVAKFSPKYYNVQGCIKQFSKFSLSIGKEMKRWIKMKQRWTRDAREQLY